MKNNILIVTYTTLISAIVLIAMLLFFNLPLSDERAATEVVIHSDKPIVLETLQKGNMSAGVYKVKIDSSEYILVYKSEGVAIVKHK